MKNLSEVVRRADGTFEDQHTYESQEGERIMKHYTIEPNKDATTWFVKVEGVAAPEEYDKYDKAIEAGERMAEENKPSTLTIMTENNEVEQKRTFDD